MRRSGGGKRTQTLHTLNGTAVAVGRTIVALLENGQQASDGSVERCPVVQNRMPVGAQGRHEQGPLIGLFGSLTSMIVLPYLGATVARRELGRPAPPRRLGVGQPGDVSAELDTTVRLTYRTARVLRAIGDYPGASNREVAERAGIVDQGQVSKLLSRLEARELIVKIGEGRTRGAPNSWRLSERGELVLKAASTNRSGM
jgi:hypothetical protein